MDLHERLTAKTIEYTGAKQMETPADARLEIAGLRNAIKQAEEMISRWEQVLLIAEIGKEEDAEEGPDDDGQEEA